MDDLSENSDCEDILTMVEAEDLKFYTNAVKSRSNEVLKRVKYDSRNEVKSKRKKPNQPNDEILELEYEKQTEYPTKIKNLLPIKTDKGIIKKVVTDYKDLAVDEDDDEENDNHEDDSSLDESELALTIPKSEAELLGIYNKTLQNKKFEIGTLCTALLENPEDKVMNLKSMLQILDESSTEAQLSIQKLAIVSLLEVFKDILPSYQIKHHNTDGVKLKKETLHLQKYEEVLLFYYKKYLQKLENFSSIFYKKVDDSRKHAKERQEKLGELSVHIKCNLLVSHPYFNFAPNIAQAVVPLLNHSSPTVRQTVSSACKTVFKEDKREEITIKILRILNHYVKTHTHNIRPDALEILLHLPIKNVNLDVERDQDVKKKLMSRKHNILQLSKKEKKRKKRLQQIEKEMLETKGEENKQRKHKNLTEIVKIVFGMYFRLLKSCTNTKVLDVCLEGLAKYSDCINMDYYVDLLNLLDNLLKQEGLGFQEQLRCIQTVFAILNDQNEALSIDPSRFYKALYKNLLSVHAAKNHASVPIVLRLLEDMLIKRRKKITTKLLIGFTKRLATLSLQLLHNGSLGYLSTIKVIFQLNKTADVLLDLDVSVGDGDYQPELDEPEYCNAASTSLYELSLLARHYHPLVQKYARHIANGVPSTGEENLPMQYAKLSAEQLYNDFDPSSMAFNPAVPVPKQAHHRGKSKGSQVKFVDENFHDYCRNVFRNPSCFISEV